jgi:hypothetical protein
VTSARTYSQTFVAHVSALKFRNVFNPYADVCPYHDHPAAPKIRRENLAAVLECALAIKVDAIWIGLELGYGGGRRTGLAMTDDARLATHADLFGAKGIKRATVSGPETEITAGAVWEAIGIIKRPIFLWNVFPLHSHKPDEPLSNRRHSRYERDSCSDLLNSLIAALKPRLIVAIGRDTENALKRQGVRHHPVRHPAYGGRTKFISGINESHRIR